MFAYRFVIVVFVKGPVRYYKIWGLDKRFCYEKWCRTKKDGIKIRFFKRLVINDILGAVV